jgi:predicted dehydrogenase
LEIFGSSGALLIESDRLFQARPSEKEWRPIEVEQNELAPGMNDNEWSRGFTTYSQAIINALREGATSVEGAASFGAGHQTQLVLDAAQRSHETGCWETVRK